MNTRKLNPSLSLQKPPAKPIDTARGLIEGADFLCGKRYYRSAAYLLHQAAWQLLTLMVQRGRQPYVGPQNLAGLFCFAAICSPRLGCIFPRCNPAEKELFRLLCAAHTDALYDDAYRITPKQLEELVYRLAVLTEVAEELVNDKKKS